MLTVKKTFKDNTYTYSLMVTNSEVTHVHINNIKTNENSALLPITALEVLLGKCKTGEV
jgi:hypothetical protein